MLVSRSPASLCPTRQYITTPAKIPRYVRVNTTCWNTEDAVQTFIARGYVLSGPFDHP